jgi:hypothetical protein
MRTLILNWCGDFQGQGKVANMKHSGLYACHWCWHPFGKGLGTTGSCYADNNRRYAPMDSPLRSDPMYGEDSPTASENIPPPCRTGEEINAIGGEITDNPMCLSMAQLILRQKETGINGFCVLSLLPLFNVLLDICLDWMHVIKNVWQEHILVMLKGRSNPAMPSRPSYANLNPAQKAEKKATHKKRKQLYREVNEVCTRPAQVSMFTYICMCVCVIVCVHAIRMICTCMHPSTQSNCMQDHRAWKLAKHQQTTIDKRGDALHMTGWLPTDLRVMSKTYKVTEYLNLTRSGAWHYLFAGMGFTKGMKEAMASVIEFMADVCVMDCDIVTTPDATERRRQMRALKARAAKTLQLLEREFPRTQLVVCFHNFLHISDMMLRWNNVRNYWAFFLERSQKRTCNCLKIC